MLAASEASHGAPAALDACSDLRQAASAVPRAGPAAADNLAGRQALVENTLTHVARLADVQQLTRPIVGGEQPYGYRNKMEVLPALDAGARRSWRMRMIGRQRTRAHCHAQCSA